MEDFELQSKEEGGRSVDKAIVLPGVTAWRKQVEKVRAKYPLKKDKTVYENAGQIKLEGLF